jgi:hypothetical protein
MTPVFSMKNIMYGSSTYFWSIASTEGTESAMLLTKEYKSNPSAIASSSKESIDRVLYIAYRVAYSGSKLSTSVKNVS